MLFSHQRQCKWSFECDQFLVYQILVSVEKNKFVDTNKQCGDNIGKGTMEEVLGKKKGQNIW